MALSPQDTAAMRERIKNIDIDNNPNHRAIYQKERFNYIIAAELSPAMGLGNKVIKDSKGRNAVGVGFDMDRPESRAEWDLAFATALQKPDFHAVRSGITALSDTQVMTLFNSSIVLREEHLKAVYSCWGDLTPNERLAIEDLNYNGGDRLVGIKTKFRQNILNYATAKQQGDAALHKFLNCALWEVKINSNMEKSKGLQNRRDSEAEMLNTYARDLNILPKPDYAGGTASPIPAQPKPAPAIAQPIKANATVNAPKKPIPANETAEEKAIREFEEGFANLIVR